MIACSDEWFAAAENLIKPKPPIRDATRFVHSGAWYDGWETRRHNEEEADWVVFQLGVSSAKIVGAEVDTAFFNGNHAPAISVEACSLTEGQDVSTGDWQEVLPKIECGPSQRHFFKRPAITESNFTHVRLRMYPDGGIARFRLYGTVIPIVPQDTSAVIDLASVLNGGVAVAYSDQHFGSADNLLLPGRGHDMSDGWETKRSRTPGHVDWVVIKLGHSCKATKVVIDTAHFRGNFPQRIKVEGVKSSAQVPTDGETWGLLVGESKTGPDAEHVYDVSCESPITHVKVTMIPDGGIKRIRVFGSLV